jgi:hypothetical protein
LSSRHRWEPFLRQTLLFISLTGLFRYIGSICVDINSDSNADGLASSIDASAVGVLVTVEVYNSSGEYVDTYTGTTNSSGVFQTSWIKGLADDDYTANVTDLALAGFFWNDLLDEEDDTDGDGWPDDVFALL